MYLILALGTACVFCLKRGVFLLDYINDLNPTWVVILYPQPKHCARFIPHQCVFVVLVYTERLWELNQCRGCRHTWKQTSKHPTLHLLSAFLTGCKVDLKSDCEAKEVWGEEIKAQVRSIANELM